MLKKLFSWQYALGLFLLSYGLGIGLWYRGSTSDSFKRFYFFTALFFIFSLVWSLAALWINDSFPWPRKEYSESHRSSRRRSRSSRSSADSSSSSSAHSDGPSTDVPSPRRRRRRNKKLRKVLAACSALLFICSSYRLVTSYWAMIAERSMAVVEVYVANPQRTKASRVPFQNNPAEHKEMMFALFNVPDKEVTIQRDDKDGDKTIAMNIVVRNTRAVPISNAHIKIDSNVEIQAAGGDAFSISPTEVGLRVVEIAPVKRASSELTIPVEIKLSEFKFEVGLLVSVVGENLRPYAAAVRLRVIEKTEPEPSPAPTKR